MRLRPGHDGDDLRRLSATLTEAWTPFTLPPLTLSVQIVGDFLALRPTADCPALNALAADCVRILDALRALPTAAELARRQAQSLSPRQQSLLAAWGYPYVFEEFRFHLTLTGRLTNIPPTRIEELQAQLSTQFAPALAEPLPVDALALYLQTANQPFDLVERLPLMTGQTNQR